MNKPIVRTIIAAVLTLAIMITFVSRLMNIQIVEAETYKKMIGDNSLYKQVIKGTRGEIVDKNGEPLAGNRMGYDVVIDRATFQRERNNEIILGLIELFEELGEKYTDNLPVSSSAPFRFLDDHDTEIARVKKLVDVADYATAPQVMSWLEERYKTNAVDENGQKKFTTEQARKIIAVRYEMERTGFSYSTPYTFATDVGINSVIKIKESSYQLSGVDVVESTVREHRDPTIAPHLLGLVGKIYEEEYAELKSKGYALNDVVGKSGAEFAFEDKLRGKDGIREIFCDANGKVIEAVETTPPTPGNTVRLTIDSKLQKITAEALERQIKHLQATAAPGKGKEADKGAAVVIEVKTGKVLACVSYPSFNLDRYYEDYTELSKNELSPLLNRALLGSYLPGSCFKPVVATAGLGNSLIDAHSIVQCNQIYMLPGSPQKFTCLNHHGPIDVLNALRVSCNIYFYNTGFREGIDLIDKTAKQYGLGEYTGIELTEKHGRRSNPESKMELEGKEWYPGDTLQSSIGQLHHSFTPIQLANYAATIANRGTRMKLTMVDEIRDYSQENIVQPFQATVAEQLPYPKEVFETVVDGMKLASGPTGTALVFGNYPIQVASKTGTPETADLCNSTFITFAPADDPKIAVAVVIENGWHGYTGAPVAKDIYNEYFGLNKPQEPSSVSQS